MRVTPFTFVLPGLGCIGSPLFANPAGAQPTRYEQTSIAGTISGSIKKGHILKTRSGHVYEVADYVHLYEYEYSPDVTVFTDGGYYRLIIDGFDEPLLCKCLNCAGTTAPSSPGFPAPVSGQECYSSSIISPSPFMGNNGEILRLADGSIWEVKYEYEYLYEYNPDVVICPSRGKLAIKDKALNIERIGARQSEPEPPTPIAPVAEVIESQIDGEFSGWDGETIFQLTNGQIWEQAAFAYAYTYKYRPKVLIFHSRGGYEMQVEGMSSRVRVRRIK